MSNRTKGARLLRKFIRDTGLTDAAAAHALGVSGSALHYWLSGNVPKLEFLQRIAEWTAGVVPIVSWIDRTSAEKVEPFAPEKSAAGGR